MEVLGIEEAGSGVAHASFEPQGSIVEKFERPDVLAWLVLAIIGAGCAEGAGVERLNAELMVLGGAMAVLGPDTGFDSDKSKRSFMPELVVDFVVNGEAPDPELMSPNPLVELSVR